MAICREGYSSHCSFMERHKALVAACDISGSKEHGLLSGRRTGRGLWSSAARDGHPHMGSGTKDLLREAAGQSVSVEHVAPGAGVDRCSSGQAAWSPEGRTSPYHSSMCTAPRLT